MLRLSWWRHAFAVSIFFLVAACSGGGCSSGCAGCGITPLPGGFPNPSRITNAASARVTRPGLDFLQTNGPTLAQSILKLGMGGLIQYPIPKSQSQQNVPVIGNVTVTICPPGPDPKASPELCTADIEIGMAQLHVDAVTPSSVTITGTIPVRIQNLPIDTGTFIGTLNVGVGSGSCNGGTPNADYKPFPVDIEIPLVAETIPPRAGFTKIDGANMKVNLGISQNDVQACKDCGILSGACDSIVGFIKNLAFGTLKSAVENQLKSIVQNQLCTVPSPAAMPPCPFGSQPDSTNTKCVYVADPSTCVPMELGLEGHMDLGSALSSISPGTTGGLDILLAAGGDMDPAPDSPASNAGCNNDPTTNPFNPCQTPNGITLGFLGGSLASPQSTCVPMATINMPMGIPIPDEMKADKVMPWPQGDNGPDMGLALSGRFLDYAFGNVYNSGLLCLGVSTETFQQLSSGLLSVLIKSIKTLTFEQKSAAAAVTTRPQVPPTVKVGGGTDVNMDPLLSIQLSQFAVDFYIFSEDRFIRALTFTADLTIPVNLSTSKDPKTNPNGGLLPVLGNIVVNNAVVTNSELLTDPPATIATSLGAILGGIAGQFTGGLKPFDIGGATKSLGITLTIPDGGIRKISKGTDDFVAIFADFALAKSPAILASDTAVVLRDKVVHPEAMELSTFNRGLLPRLDVTFSSPANPSLDKPGSRAVEYAYWQDSGTRSPWSRETNVVIQNDYMFLQGKHTLYVTSRFVGEQDSEDPTPAALPYTIDTTAPFVTLQGESGTPALTAWDLVSDDAALVARTRVTDSYGNTGAWGEWRPLAIVRSSLPQDASALSVEVRDEEGNVASASVDLIRGRPDPSLKAIGGCGCSTVGTRGAPSPALGLVMAIGIALAGVRRRRSKKVASETRASSPHRRWVALLGLGSLGVVGAMNQGCSCGSTGGAAAQTGCGSDCNQPCQPGLPMGLVGAYTSLAKTADNQTIWVAGYNDSAVSSNFSGVYGDLVVGKYDPAKQQVAWTTVDGLPPVQQGVCPDNDPNGWRGGLSDSGDDVGLWTSTQLDANQNPMVSYYDATHKGLKFAAFDGTKWNTHTVLATPGSDIGRYSKMLVVNGNPVIAFLVMEPGNQGKVRSKVVLAKANIAAPAGPGDWAMEDAAVDENGPCRAAFCTGTDTCVKETNTCMTPTVGCTPADCGGTGVCVTIGGKATCGTPIGDTYIDIYPNAFADYISMASGPQGSLGIVIYDRLHGNLVGVAKTGGAWQPTIFDGETGSRAPNSGPDGGISAKDTGDVGVGASLFIGPTGDWHVSYVNGFTEALEYILAPAGGAPTMKPEVVDDGTKLDGQTFADGLHIVGDDSFIAVDANGNVTITYQDATAGTLRIATGTSMPGGTHQWQVHMIPQAGRFAGFFSRQVPNDTTVANWWRAADPASGSISGDVAIVAR